MYNKILAVLLSLALLGALVGGLIDRHSAATGSETKKTTTTATLPSASRHRSTEDPTWQKKIEAAIAKPCPGVNGIKTLAMGVEYWYEGSRTDYWVVVCEPGAPEDVHLIDLK